MRDNVRHQRPQIEAVLRRRGVIDDVGAALRPVCWNRGGVLQLAQSRGNGSRFKWKDTWTVGLFEIDCWPLTAGRPIPMAFCP